MQEGKAFFAQNRQMLNEGLQELRNLQKKVKVRPYPDPESEQTGATSSWISGDKNGTPDESFTPTIRKCSIQMFKVANDSQTPEAPQANFNCGKKVMQ